MCGEDRHVQAVPDGLCRPCPLCAASAGRRCRVMSRGRGTRTQNLRLSLTSASTAHDFQRSSPPAVSTLSPPVFMSPEDSGDLGLDSIAAEAAC